MKRRKFLLQGALAGSGLVFMNSLPSFAGRMLMDAPHSKNELYGIFRDPDNAYRPFVRWWWNGDKVEKTELTRELRLLKEAGIGGVEINPIGFPGETDDMGRRSIPWLSREWIDLLKFTFAQAKELGLTCDLLVGSGWPFGAEYLEGEERSQIVVTGVQKLEGPLNYEVSLFDLFKIADPDISSPYPGRKMEMLSVRLVPGLMDSLDQVKDLSGQIPSGTIKANIPEGKYVLYALVKITGFMKVINGAPGASGPVLNHYNKAAVNKYLHRMSDIIQERIGPLSGYIRAFFLDSMELEGSNWCADMAEEFGKRRGYDLMPWLPFILFKIGRMGNVYDYNNGADFDPGLEDRLQQVRYDFYLTQCELLQERFVYSFTSWCRENKVKSRAQAYGRGYFPLEGSFNMDIPECETWIRYGLGTDMSESDYRIGRAYTMINKYVSSAAHFQSKRLISCEELTNIGVVFNTTLEMCKLAADQSAISGTTQAVFHGFNYSPPDAPFPGWVRYGTFINERNPWWPYFHHFTDYRSRFSALLQQGDMFADIAVLLPVPDTWGKYGAQNEPFPSLMYPGYQTFVWESIHQNGCACDYVSEQVIGNARVQEGQIQYGPRTYHTIFLVAIQHIEPATAGKLFDFVSSGGRIFCVEKYPEKSPGWNNHQEADAAVRNWVDKMKAYPDRFILLEKPEPDFTQWFREVRQKYGITPYVAIDEPNKFVSQVRYSFKDAEMLLFINSSMQDTHEINISPGRDIGHGKQAWIWDATNGERYWIAPGEKNITLALGPADSRKSSAGPAICRFTTVAAIFSSRTCSSAPSRPKNLPEERASSASASACWRVMRGISASTLRHSPRSGRRPFCTDQ